MHTARNIIHVFSPNKYEGYLSLSKQSLTFVPDPSEELSAHWLAGTYQTFESFSNVCKSSIATHQWRFATLEPTGSLHQWFVITEGKRVGVIHWHSDCKRWSAIIENSRHEFPDLAEIIALVMNNSAECGTLLEIYRPIHTLRSSNLDHA